MLKSEAEWVSITTTRSKEGPFYSLTALPYREISVP